MLTRKCVVHADKKCILYTREEGLLRERVLHLFYLCMAILLYEGTCKCGFLPLPTKQRVKSAAVGVLWLVASSCATGFQERRGSLYSTGEGAVTVKGHGCFGLFCFC